MKSFLFVLLSLGHAAGSNEFRFSKLGMQDATTNKPMLLADSTSASLPIQYPITDSLISALPEDTPADSLRSETNTQVTAALSSYDNFSAADSNAPSRIWSYNELGEPGGLLLNQKLKATHPDATNETEQNQFWQEFSELVALRALREEGTTTEQIMPIHRLFDRHEHMSKSASRVEKDFPTHFPTEQLLLWASETEVKAAEKLGGDYLHPHQTNEGKPRWGTLALDPNITHACNGGKGKEFINVQVILGEIIGWAVRTVSAACFGLKWHVGRARPEEVAYCIANPNDTECPSVALDAPSHTNSTILDNWAERPKLDLRGKAASAFTAYAGGSPMHPSYPAMHSAASSLSTWIDVVADLTDDQRAEVRLLDYSIAYFRSLAGVHYSSDNRAGLALGQHIMEKQLPKFLAERFSCDAASKENIFEYVSHKIRNNQQKQTLDWAAYTPDRYFWDDGRLGGHIARAYKEAQGQFEYWNNPTGLAESRGLVGLGSSHRSGGSLSGTDDSDEDQNAESFIVPVVIDSDGSLSVERKHPDTGYPLKKMENTGAKYAGAGAMSKRPVREN